MEYYSPSLARLSLDRGSSMIVALESSTSVTQHLTLSANLSPFDQPLPEVSRYTHRASNEVHDIYDPSTLTTFAGQRQQHPVSHPLSSHSVDPRPSSAADSRRPLRRVRRAPEARQLPHRRAVSLDVTGGQPPRPQPAHSIPALVNPDPRNAIEVLPPALSEAQTDENGSTVDDPYQLLNSSYWPQRNTGVSSRTASAILFALEEAIRRPFPFTTDWDEANASMSDMVGVAGPAGPAGPVGNGRAQNGNPRAPQGSSQPPSGVRTPTDIMRQRRDREARRKAEQEARDREQEDLERQQLEQEQAQAQAQRYAADVAAEPVPQRRARPQRAPRGAEVPPEAVVATTGAAPPFASSTGPAPTGERIQYQVPSGGVNMSQQRPPQSSSQQNLGAAPQHARSQSAAAGTGVPTGTPRLSKPTQAPPTSQPGGSQTLQQPKRATFPHAFERWETLSSHWEGLTSYWIRKLEQHNDDLEKDPLSQQLARQITDLSAAGANLFHAVVELQRLRASSERKFQRWFFDTRAEQERAKEVQADLERQLTTERQGRADAFAAAQTAEKDKTRAEDLLREMNRELKISKEEARRAWEELGRREQEERDRTTSLRVPSRHTSRPPTREGPYPGGPTTTSMGTEFQNKPAEASYYDEAPPMSPTGSDPFIENQKQQPADPSKPPYPIQMYEHEPTTSYPGPATSEVDAHSYVGSSEAEEEYNRYPGESQSQPYSYAQGPLSEGSDEYDQSPNERYSAATTSAPMPPTTADYSGTGWGAGTGWESVTPRHRHPTRLSDVLEEDERSRTSPSRASQASRSIL
ncbi:two-component sensor protein histidine protein kinase [Penicillium atrosanguineum]|uniref:two-component sensor protein histidine protein kinase n=1 Tax=Penicillium atrosanguineum TaxID=1132637 RepID=UPI00239EEDF2|nr:two-component sensor protein histidine protein kinase [Penicillium atrosanguineum]KAJ5297001.1 two-component sensor protein histidine protein kinase [Penicillium atrosanguineum]